MRFPFEAHQGNRIPFQRNIPGRTFRNPPHPENATHYSAKNRVAVSQALDATLAQGMSPTAGRKGTSPAAAWSFKNVPNDYKCRTMATTQVEDGQRATSRTNKLA